MDESGFTDARSSKSGWPWSGLSTTGRGRAAVSMRASVEGTFLSIAALFRGLWAVLVVVTVAGPSFLEPIPRAAGPVVVATVAWSAYLCRQAWLARQQPDRFPARAFAWLDSGIFALMLVGEASLVPVSLIGDGTSWVYVGASMSVFIAAALVRFREALAITMLLITAYLAGITAAGESIIAPDGIPTASLLLVQGLISAGAVLFMRRTADRADESLVLEAEVKRKAEVAEGEERDRAIQDRLLHNKVRSTLWLVGDGHLIKLPEVAIERCRESLRALGELREGRIERERLTSVVHAVNGAVDRARAFGLIVTVSSTLNVDDPAASGTPDVCRAFADATEQVLLNVRKHAQTQRAEVDVTREADVVRVVIRDEGRGFDFAMMRVGAQGIRDSITSCMAEVGGRAIVTSRPGAGTIVELSWRAPSAEARPAPEPLGGSAARQIYGTRALYLLLATGCVFYGLALFATLHFHFDYYYPWLTQAAWATQVAVAAGIVSGIGRRPRLNLVRAGVVLIIVAAVVVVINTRAQGVLGFASWAFGLTTLPLGLAAAWLSLKQIAFAVLVHDLAQFLITAFKLGLDLSGLVKLSAILLLNLVLQIGLGQGFAVLMGAAEVTARSVWRSKAIRTRRYVRQLVRRARSRRADSVNAEVYNLLSLVSSGEADCRDGGVQLRFKTVTSSMQREDVLAEVESDLRRLTDVAQRAERNGVRLELQFAAKIDKIPAEILESMLDAVILLLEMAAPGRVQLEPHNDEDLTIRDWDKVGMEAQKGVHSLSMSFLLERAKRPPVEDLLRRKSEQKKDFRYDLIFADLGDEITKVWLNLAGE